MLRRCPVAALGRQARRPLGGLPPRSRAVSSCPSAVHDMLARPTWSVASLLDGHPAASPSSPSSPSPGPATPSDAAATPSDAADAPITPAQLHHLLRLAALPLPASEQEEAGMLATLDSQLRFVRAVQGVDTRGVEPLCAIRDETAQGLRERTVGLADLRHAIDAEVRVGHYGRPRRPAGASPAPAHPDAQEWNVLSTAPRKAGKYLVVESAPKDGGPR